MSSEELKRSQRSIRKHLVAGLAVVLLLAGGLGGWGSTVPISGALIAPGQVVVESNVKKVQHPTGGVVGEVRARDGDLVKAGDIVVRLDDTVTKANLAIVTKNLDAAQARASRLQAEQRGLTKLEFSLALLERARDPDVEAHDNIPGGNPRSVAHMQFADHAAGRVLHLLDVGIDDQLTGRNHCTGELRGRRPACGGGSRHASRRRAAPLPGRCPRRGARRPRTRGRPRQSQ